MRCVLTVASDRKSSSPTSTFDNPRATPLFGPTLRGEPPVRCDDVQLDERYGRWAPHYGMPAGHPAVRSYLGVPVASRDGRTVGGLFFGHAEPGVFSRRSERLVVGIAAQASSEERLAVATHVIDNTGSPDDLRRRVEAVYASLHDAAA